MEQRYARRYSRPYQNDKTVVQPTMPIPAFVRCCRLHSARAAARAASSAKHGGGITRTAINHRRLLVYAAPLENTRSSFSASQPRQHWRAKQLLECHGLLLSWCSRKNAATRQAGPRLASIRNAGVCQAVLQQCHSRATADVATQKETCCAAAARMGAAARRRQYIHAAAGRHFAVVAG